MYLFDIISFISSGQEIKFDNVHNRFGTEKNATQLHWPSVWHSKSLRLSSLKLPMYSFAPLPAQKPLRTSIVSLYALSKIEIHFNSM